MPDQFLRLEDISHSYGTMIRAAVESVSLSVQRNEFFSLLGPSGCGKTTLLRLIAGFEAPSAGRILLSGQDISRLPPWRRAVNTVFQSYALFPHLSVVDNVAFGLRMRGMGQRDRRARAVEALDLVRMAEFADRPIRALSGGQQQRVALARALACRPDILLLDEPLSALDARLRREMQLELKRLQRESGTTFVFVTHDQEEAMSMSDRLAVMGGGRLLQLGTPAEVYDAPASREVAEFIGESNILSATAGPGGSLLGPGGLPLGLQGPAGSSVLVRPEDLVLAEGGVPARILDRQFTGGGSLLLLDLGGVNLLSRGADPSRRDLALGATVAVVARRARILP